MAAADEARKLARTLADLERRLRSVETGSQLGRSGIQIGGETVSVKDAVRASITASQQAAEAIERAASAEAKADGVVNTYYTDGATPPSEKPGLGDFWYRRDTKDVSVWDGDSWEPVTSTAVKAAIAAADLAAAAADGKISTFFLPSTKPPTGPGEGDIWFVTDQGNRQRRYDGSKWVDVRDGGIQDALDKAADAAAKAAGAEQAATVAVNSANGKTKVVYSTSNPTTDGVNVGDTWFVRDANNYILTQYQWDGSAWQSVILTNATVTTLDAGRITSGSLAVGVKITAGTPGGDRVELSSQGLFGYIGGNLRLRLDNAAALMTADVVTSSGALSSGRSYLRFGQSAFGDNTDNLTFFQPGYNAAVLRNTLNTGEGALEVALQSGSSSGKSYYFDTNSLSSDGTFSLRNRTYGVGVTITNVTQIGGYYGNLTAGGYYDSWYNSYGITLGITSNGSGVQVTSPPNGAYGTAFVRNTYSGGGALKFTSDNALQARTNNDGGYAYFRGIIQDQSNPELKENIVELKLDAVTELSGMKYYAYDWKREPVIPFVPPPRDSSTGLLLSEVPNSVQQTEDGYSTGSLLGLVIAAVNQLAGEVAVEKTYSANLSSRLDALEA